MSERCSARVYPRDGSYRAGGGWPCSNSATVQEQGKHWCRTHAPSAVKAREEKSRARQAEERKRLDRQWAMRRACDEIVRRAKDWRASDHSRERVTDGTKKLAAAVDRLLALEKGDG